MSRSGCKTSYGEVPVHPDQDEGPLEEYFYTNRIHDDVNAVGEEDASSVRQLLRQWRAYNVEQQLLNNCRALWDRYTQKNRRDVEEAVEMLKCLAQLGALTAGFAVSAFYDFQYTASSDNPVLPFFGLATALTVGFQLNSCVMCTLLLSSVVKIGKSYLTDEEEAEYLWRLRGWAAARIEISNTHSRRPISTSSTSHCHSGQARVVALRPQDVLLYVFGWTAYRYRRHWDTRCERLWRTALGLFLSGIPTFFAVMGLAGYLKFFTSPSTVIITGLLMAAAFVYTVTLSADWAKALLGGGITSTARGPTPDHWQAGGWWHYTEPPSSTSGSSPFGFHSPPDKDSMWPPPLTDAPRPFGRTLEELPYPAIVGLQPWPGPALTRDLVGRGEGAGVPDGQEPPVPASSSGAGLVQVGQVGTRAGPGAEQGASERSHDGVGNGEISDGST
ncbi:hypothetical protein VOLCADRAFT_121327 [Volvox carteri f. nagariensis]|uniref:Uncharacterized protein n=1 Tax=Volvox carteri f. nagariensis TaxID=3068 RepID=D8U7D1_VOLCA|nr:uncharacterized protein VOLCADRAFT_121327 [Volvox carteri f. nagariensis]EFJ44464.1 hypothetical protein VOLCADRAFT_121327 [Volvox carteri f. nagariensis]|eukprot:XP_002954571.1 hypothetical protein VOLCADRAFT_121327 [Volvox carteri f. nagariensis]